MRFDRRSSFGLGVLAAVLLGGCVGGARSGRRPALGGTGSGTADGGVADAPAPGPGAGPAARPSPPVARSTGPSRAVFAGTREVGRLTKEDFEEFNRAWVLFVRKDRAWPEARERWLARGGAAPYVLSENLLRYFVSATAYGDRRDLNWIAVSAQKAGEPAVAYFADLLVLDKRPLAEPVVVKDSDGHPRTLTDWQNDDVTRQQLAYVLAAIGPPAVPRLVTPPFLHAQSPSARRYIMYALGRIGTDEAVDAVATMLSEPEWQDRGSAAKALGLAIVFTKSERARPPLQRALSDPDEFVRKKAREGLDGKTKSEF